MNCTASRWTIVIIDYIDKSTTVPKKKITVHKSMLALTSPSLMCTSLCLPFSITFRHMSPFSWKNSYLKQKIGGKRSIGLQDNATDLTHQSVFKGAGENNYEKCVNKCCMMPFVSPGRSLSWGVNLERTELTKTSVASPLSSYISHYTSITHTNCWRVSHIVGNASSWFLQ